MARWETIWVLVIALGRNIRRLPSELLWKLGIFISFGWASARANARLLAGIVAIACPGRVGKSRHLALAHPILASQSALFSHRELQIAFWRKFRHKPKTPVEWAVIESARALANRLWPRLLRWEPLFLKKGDLAAHTYRPIVKFDPSHSLAQTVAARHLVQCVDPDLHDCNWARRLRCGGIVSPTRNDPVARMRDFRLRHAGRVLYVAKLDVKGLHDTISHAAVRRAMAEAVVRAAKRGVTIDWRVLRLVETLLASFSFGVDMLGGASKTLKEKDPEGTVPWPLQELKRFHRDPLTARIGLPQGSPFSDILANLVLDAVDRAVVGVQDEPGLLYARYLDDILIVHTDRAKCEAALTRAMDALHKLGLIPHPPKTFGLSDIEYWRAKSLAPTVWAPRGEGREWVGFLGYEVRFDGEVRIRRETIQRHKVRWKEMAERHQVEFDEEFTGGGRVRGAGWFAAHAARSVALLERDLARACLWRRRSWIRSFPLAAFGGEALAKQAKDLDGFRRLLLSRYRRHVKEQGRRAGYTLGDVRGIRDHYRRSYYYNLVARFAANVVVAPGARSKSRLARRFSNGGSHPHPRGQKAKEQEIGMTGAGRAGETASSNAVSSVGTRSQRAGEKPMRSRDRSGKKRDRNKGGRDTMKNASNHVHGISVNGRVPINAILDGAEFLINGRNPGAYRITIEHMSDEGRPLPVTVVWYAPELFLIKKRRRPGKQELESLRSVANCLERACCVLEEIVDEQGDMRKGDSLYPNVAVAQKSVNFPTRDRNHSPAFRATRLVAKGRKLKKMLEGK